MADVGGCGNRVVLTGTRVGRVSTAELQVRWYYLFGNISLGDALWRRGHSGCTGSAASASLIGTDVSVSVTGQTIDGPLVIFPSLVSDTGFGTSLTVTAGAGPNFELGSQPAAIVVERTYRVDIQDSANFFESWPNRNPLNGSTITSRGLMFGPGQVLQSVSLVPGPGANASGIFLLGFKDTSFGLDLSGLSNTEFPYDDFTVVLGLGVSLRCRRPRRSCC